MKNKKHMSTIGSYLEEQGVNMQSKHEIMPPFQAINAQIQL